MKLIDVCDFQGGSQPPKEEWSFEKQNGYIRMLQIRDFTQSERVIPEFVMLSKNLKICEADDILIARYGASVGKILTGLSGAYNVAIMRTIPDINKIKKRYLYYFLKSPYFQSYILSIGSRAAQAGFNKEDLSKLEIICPSFSVQDIIVDTLTTAEKVIEQRKRELQILDDLIKARFVEMFGDPISNEKGWSTAPLAAVCSRIYGGGTPSKSHPEYFEGSIPWVSPKDMKSDVITDSIDHITEEAIKNSTTNMVPEGSVLMVIRSGILKHALPVAINAVPVTINQDMKAFVPAESITASFLRNYFKAIETDVLAGVRGVTADNIDFKAFQQREIIVPPIYLQRSFEAFCRQVDKSKVAVQKALEEAQRLFDSLMQKFFG